MKRIFKFIPVALTAITLSSCSSDDLFSSLGFDSNSPRTLEVTVEQLNDGDITRAANVGDGNTLIWQNNDVITVYDDKLFLYDPYTFNGTSFVIADDKHIVETPQFALFPNAYFGEGSTFYSRNDDKVYAKANIPASLNYGKAYVADETEGSPYVTSNGKAAYVSLLPMWGTASVENGKTGVSLHYMTAILKVTLTNAMGNVSYLYVKGTKDIAGTQPAQLNGEFKVDLSSTGRTPLTSTTMVPTKANPAAADGLLEVDLRNINKATSVIYVPIPAGHYGLLQVWAGAKNEVYNAATNKIYEFVDKDFEVKFYGSLTKKTYAVDGTSISKINNLLIANRDEAKDELTLDCSAAATAVAAGGETITLPNMAAGSVELKLHSFTTGAVTVAGSEFSKKFILNFANTNAQPVTIDLPNADVVLAGDFGDKDVTILNAKTLTFGKGTNTANATKKFGTIDIKAEVKGVVTVAKDAKILKSDDSEGAITLAANHRSTGVEVKAGGTAGAITVNASATVSATTVNVAGTAGNITTPNDASTVEVSGKAGAIAMTGTGKATITGMATSVQNTTGGVEISGAPYFDITNDKYAKVNGNVTTTGDVEVNLSGEGAAISGTLTMARGKTLTLNQGYIKTIADPTGSSGNLAVNLNTSAAYLAINSLSTSNVTVSGTTQWNGKDFGGSLSNSTRDANNTALAAAGVTEVKTEWATYADASTAVYTAMGLVANKATFTLKNNINLNNKAWTPVATTDDIDGGGKTISNLTVAVPANGAEAAAATAGLGLFSDLKNNVTNLILDGVTINAVKYTTGGTGYVVDNIGALAGKVSVADKTIKAVTVKNVDLSSTGGAKNIGGVIGTNTAAVTLTGVKLEGSNEIAGYYQMGGLVGYAAENVTINTKAKTTAPVTAADVVCAATASFTANYNSATTTPALDKKYLSVGNFIGAALNTKTIAITCAAADVNATKTVDLSIFPGFTKHNVDVNFYDYIFGQTLIGWSGDATFTTAPVINTKSYQYYGTAAAGTAADLVGSVAKPFALYYINM